MASTALGRRSASASSSGNARYRASPPSHLSALASLPSHPNTHTHASSSTATSLLASPSRAAHVAPNQHGAGAGASAAGMGEKRRSPVAVGKMKMRDGPGAGAGTGNGERIAGAGAGDGDGTSGGASGEGSGEGDDDAAEDEGDGDETLAGLGLGADEEVRTARADKRMKRHHPHAQQHAHTHTGHSPHCTPTAASFKRAHAGVLAAAAGHTASPLVSGPASASAPGSGSNVGGASASTSTPHDAARKRKNQRLASQAKKAARREKMAVNGLGAAEGGEWGHEVSVGGGDREGTDGESEGEGEGDEGHQSPRAPSFAGYQLAPARRDASKHMGEGKRKGGNKGKGRGGGGVGGGLGGRKGGRSPVRGQMEMDGADASDGDISSNDTDDDMEADDDEPPSGAALTKLDDEMPLPNGVDPANVEDPLLDAVPAALAVRDGAAAWMEETSDEEFMFASLSDYSVTEIINDEEQSASATTGDSSDSSDSAMDEDDDPLLNDVFGSAIGLHDNGDLPLVLMEDWSGNLVFAQPRIAEDDDEPARRTSKSRSRSSRSARGSRTGSTSNGDGPVLLIDSEAVDAGWDDEYDEDVDGGDTTDSLPSDEDMPSPPDIGPFSLAAKGLEANNAAFGVTTIDEAALAQDLGVPLEDARNLLERVRAEDAMQNQIGMSDAVSSISGSVVTPGDATLVDGILHTADTPGSSAGPAHSPLVPQATPVAFPPQASVPGVPMMGSFLPECADPGKRAVIDGTGKNTPSPFARKGTLRSRSRGAKAGSSTVKKQAVGPMSPLHRGRYSSVPPRGRFRHGASHSPLRVKGSFDREDTPSDAEMTAEPISLDDVLDTDALHRHTYETEGHEHDGSHHLRNLRRWEKVPITTFRRSRINSSTEDVIGTDLRSSHGYSASGAALRNAMGSPGATDSHRSTLIFSQGMIISPILQPIEEGSYGGGSPNHLSRKSRRKEERRARNDGTKRLRTSSLGNMPPLDLGSGLV